MARRHGQSRELGIGRMRRGVDVHSRELSGQAVVKAFPDDG